jgi:hypothetical protein
MSSRQARNWKDNRHLVLGDAESLHDELLNDGIGWVTNDVAPPRDISQEISDLERWSRCERAGGSAIDDVGSRRLQAGEVGGVYDSPEPHGRVMDGADEMFNIE